MICLGKVDSGKERNTQHWALQPKVSERATALFAAAKPNYRNICFARSTPRINASTSLGSLYTYTDARAVAGTFNRRMSGCAQ
jgi:hypothetical protein